LKEYDIHKFWLILMKLFQTNHIKKNMILVENQLDCIRIVDGRVFSIQESVSFFIQTLLST